MLGRRRWIRFAIVILALGLLGGAVASCGGSSSTTPRTGIIVYNSPVGGNTHSIVEVTIGGTPAVVNIAVGGTLFMPTAPGSHLIAVEYDDTTVETGQNPPDPVVVLVGHSVTVDFTY